MFKVDGQIIVSTIKSSATSTDITVDLLDVEASHKQLSGRATYNICNVLCDFLVSQEEEVEEVFK